MVEHCLDKAGVAGSFPAGSREFMNNNEYPCTCGHDRDYHRGIGMPPETQHCWVFECPCKRYKADNLKYLEQEYGRKYK